MIEIYASGPASLSVCAPKVLSVKQIEDEVNRIHPTGIDSNWEIAKENYFADGSLIPTACEQRAEHLHYLLHC